MIRPAAGTRLQPVDRLRHGDQVVGFDGAPHTVITAWQGRDRWWVVTYASGERASLPPGTVTRVADDAILDTAGTPSPR